MIAVPCRNTISFTGIIVPTGSASSRTGSASSRTAAAAACECTWWLGAGGAILPLMDVDVAALTGNALAGPPRHLDEDKVSRYAQILDQMPPVVVFELDDGLLLVDGYHRVEAARRLGRAVVRAEVRQGSRADALRFAVDLAAAGRGVTKGQALDAIRRRSGRRWGMK